MKKVIFFFALLLVCNYANLYIVKTNIKQVQTFIDSIIKQEKLELFVKPNFNNYSGNITNVGCLKYFTANKFRKFNSVKEGYDALIYDLTLKVTGKSIYTDETTTLYQLIYIYAPSFENNNNNYLQIVCNEIGITANTLIKDIDVRLLARGIIRIENIKVYKQLYL